MEWLIQRQNGMLIRGVDLLIWLVPRWDDEEEEEEEDPWPKKEIINPQTNCLQIAAAQHPAAASPASLVEINA